MGLPSNMEDLKRQIIEKGVAKLLDEAKVPQRIHLQVIQALAQRTNQHKQEIQAHEATIASHQQVIQSHERQIANWDEISKHLTSIDRLKGDKGDSIQGLPGKDAEPVDEDALVTRIQSLIRIPEDGKPGEKGKDADEEKILGRLIEKIKKEKPLDISHIRNAQTFMKDGIKYKFEELMKGGGTAGGSSGYQVPTSGTVDGVNQVFGWAKAPNIIVVDQGRAMQRVSSDGTINWTVVGTTTTFSIAPTFDVYAIS